MSLCWRSIGQGEESETKPIVIDLREREHACDGPSIFWKRICCVFSLTMFTAFTTVRGYFDLINRVYIATRRIIFTPRGYMESSLCNKLSLRESTFVSKDSKYIPPVGERDRSDAGEEGGNHREVYVAKHSAQDKQGKTKQQQATGENPRSHTLHQHPPIRVNPNPIIRSSLASATQDYEQYQTWILAHLATPRTPPPMAALMHPLWPLLFLSPESSSSNSLSPPRPQVQQRAMKFVKVKGLVCESIPHVYLLRVALYWPILASLMTGGVRFGLCAEEERELVEQLETMDIVKHQEDIIREKRERLEARYIDSRKLMPNALVLPSHLYTHASSTTTMSTMSRSGPQSPAPYIALALAPPSSISAIPRTYPAAIRGVWRMVYRPMGMRAPPPRI